MTKQTLILGTRGSPLALWQAEWVKAELLRRHEGLEVVLELVRTQGDKILDSPLSRINDKGLFTKEIEQQLLNGRIDLAVHSLKDLPTTLPEGLTLAAVTAREDPADAWLSKQGSTIEQLPAGAVVLTGSLRRRAQLLHRRGDLDVRDVRGTVQTRLRKLDEGAAEGMVLAVAGLKRSGLDGRMTRRLDPRDFLPACGQGALAVETRAADESTRQLLAGLDDRTGRACTTAERTVLARLEGGCQVPIGAYATVEGNQLQLWALIAALDGQPCLRTQVHGPLDQAEKLGEEAAVDLVRQGAEAILAEIRKVH